MCFEVLYIDFLDIYINVSSHLNEYHIYEGGAFRNQIIPSKIFHIQIRSLRQHIRNFSLLRVETRI